MKNLLQKNIPKEVFWGVIAAFFYVLSVLTAFEIGRISINKIPHHPREVVNKPPIRVPLFVPPSKVRHRRRFVFSFDDPLVLQPLRKRERLDFVLKGTRGDLEVFQRLMKWVRAQWSPSRPDPYPPINALIILDKIRKGETGGFCAQYCFVLCQALQSLGYKARYVTVKGHEVIEAWSPKYNKWIMLDPMYEAFVEKNGIPLSVIEMHDFLFTAQDLTIHANRPLPNKKRYLSRFKNFAIWIKNDHVSSPINFSDIERYKVYFLNTLEERLYIPPESLFTFFREDLYFNPYEG